MKIDMAKTYRYRNGEPARVLCVDRNCEMPVISMSENGVVRAHREDGSLFENSEFTFDLIEVVPKWRGKVWVKGDLIEKFYEGHDVAGWKRQDWRLIEVEEVES